MVCLGYVLILRSLLCIGLCDQSGEIAHYRIHYYYCQVNGLFCLHPQYPAARKRGGETETKRGREKDTQRKRERKACVFVCA